MATASQIVGKRTATCRPGGRVKIKKEKAKQEAMEARGGKPNMEKEKVATKGDQIFNTNPDHILDSIGWDMTIRQAYHHNRGHCH